MYESLKDSSPPWLDHNKITHGQQRQTDTVLAKCEQNELVPSQQEEPGQGANVSSEEIFHTVKQLGSHSQCCSCRRRCAISYFSLHAFFKFRADKDNDGEISKEDWLQVLKAANFDVSM